MSDKQDRIAQIRERLTAIETERRDLTRQLTGLERRHATPTRGASRPSDTTRSPVTKHSPPADKIALFRRLFAGRDDVFPVRWENVRTRKSGYAPACSNEWEPGICQQPQVKCGECPHQAFVAVSDAIIRRHLAGSSNKATATEFVAGVYPLLPDDTCRFLAVDFDGEHWAADAVAFVQTCAEMTLPAALERSRSGAGGHVWMFFAEPLPARFARQLGSVVLTEAMDRRPEIGFKSYDRFFPSQDVMPSGGFGNLIALPLQSRARKDRNTLFIDTDLRPYDDQWAFLSALVPIPRARVEAIVAKAEAGGRVTGVRMPVEDDNADQPWLATPSRRWPDRPIIGVLPRSVDVVLA